MVSRLAFSRSGSIYLWIVIIAGFAVVALLRATGSEALEAA
jgi:hypothetical protein